MRHHPWSGSIRAKLSRPVLVSLLASVAILEPAGIEPRHGEAAATTVLGARPPLVARPSYFRPVIVGGKAFPVARSNFLSLLAFPNNWHAPRLRLIDGRWELVGIHEGIDITAERGTPVLSMTDGVVEATGWTFYSGTRVGIRGRDGRYYFYAHLDRIEPGIVPGAAVSVGDVLGRVGNTGYGDPGHRDEFPPHLHLGIEAASSEWVNPYPTLVSLYDAAVRTQSRWQARLDELAAEGDRAGWQRASAEALMGPAAEGE